MDAQPQFKPNTQSAARPQSADARKPDSAARGGGSLLVVIVLLAAAWRVVMAVQMPCLSRDGALYCWQARDLGQTGLSLLRDGRYEQHPLYAASILGIERVAVACGAADSPLLWQRCGQFASLAAGVVVVLLSALLASRLVCALQLPVSSTLAAAAAALLSAMLPLDVWLSADVMSDELHLAFFLGSAACLLAPVTWRGAAGLIVASGWRSAASAGSLAGLAFLTRPEGAVVWLAGVLALAAARNQRLSLRVGRALVLSLGFAAIAAPYVVLAGKLSPKLDKESVEKFASDQGAGGVPCRRPFASAWLFDRDMDTNAARATLVRQITPWYLLLPTSLYGMLRAGRVVVTLLGAVALWGLRRRLAEPPLLLMLLCLALHVSLATWNLHRAGYLDPRHLLVDVQLLLPLAGIALTHAAAWLNQRRRGWLTPLLVLACAAPLALYSQRVPNAQDAYVPKTVAELKRRDAALSQRLLLGGASQRRLAFYANMRFQPWPENEPTFERRQSALRDHVLKFRPDYVAIETARGPDAADNSRLLGAVLADPTIAAAAQMIETLSAGDEIRLHVVRLAWPAEP